MPSALAVQSGV